MPDVTIRSATPDDALGVGRLIAQLGYDVTVEASRRRLVQLTDRVEHSVYVAVIDNRIAGVIQTSIIETLEHEPRAEIRALCVDEPHRGTGIGAMLIAAAEKWARDRRLQKIRVRSNIVRDRTREFYERLGYVVTKTQNVFDKTL